MTINTTSISTGPYTGANNTDTYIYDFKVQLASEIVVVETDLAGAETTLVLGTDFSVTGVGNNGGGNVVRTAGNLPTGFLWFISRTTALTQDTDFPAQGGFTPETHEDAFDKAMMIAQENAADILLAVRAPASDSSPDMVLPAALVRAGQFPVFDAAGDVSTSLGSGGGDTSLRTDLASIAAAKGFNLVAITQTAEELAVPVVPSKPQFKTRSIKRFNGTGDGSVNDTTPFANTLAASYGDVLFLPNGTWFIDPTVITSGIEIIGESRRYTILRCRSTANTEAVLHTNGLAVNDIILRHLTLDVNRALNSGNAFLRGLLFGPDGFDPTTPELTGIVLDDVRVTGSASHNIQITYATGARLTELISDDFNTFGVGFFRNCKRCRVDGGTIETDASANAIGLIFDDRSTDNVISEPCTHNIVSALHINGKNTMQIGIDIEGGWGNIISKAVLFQVDQFGVLLASSDADSVPDQEADYNLLDGVIIDDMNSSSSGRAAIRVQGAYNRVEKAIIRSPAGLGISQILPADTARTSHHNAYNENTITLAGAGGMLFQEGTDCQANGNIIDQITGDGIRMVPLAAGSSGGALRRWQLLGNEISKTSGHGYAIESNTNALSDVDIEGGSVTDWDTGAVGGKWGVFVTKGAGALDDVSVNGVRFIESDGGATLVAVRLAGAITNIRLSLNKTKGLSAGLSNAASAGALIYDSGNQWNAGLTEASSQPLSGSFIESHFVRNTSISLDGNNMAIFGWLRLTTGSGHVSGTDWSTMYISHVTPAT